MPIVALILKALLAKYGAELVYRLLQQLAPEPMGPQDLHLAQRLERTAAAGSMTPVDRAQLDVMDSDFEDERYIWDEPCDPRH